MMVPTWILGALVGLAMAMVTWIVLGKAIEKQTEKEGRIDRTGPSNILDLVRKVELVTLPLIGAAIGYYVFGGAQ